MAKVIVDLYSKAALSPARAGGKGAGLAWLHRQGFPTPPGFVVTTTAFRDLSASDALDGAPLSATAENAIRAAYRRLGGPVAVRSSLVAEDAAATSFAGQLDTFLDVMGEEEVLRAVRACEASLHGPRAAAYLEQRALAPGDLAMAVVVQRMAATVAAGVAFSADPVTGEAQVVIEGTAGRGDAVVGGAALADRYVVDARGVLAEIIPATAGRPILAETQALQLAALVRDIERRAGRPQDVEWAWDGAGFCVLQSRPITALAGRHIYSRRVVGEMAPGLVKPLVYSVNVLAIGTQVFGRLFTDLIGPTDMDYTALVPRIHSRVYGDMTLMGDLFARAGLPPNMIEMMYQEERARHGGMGMGMAMLRPLPYVARFAARHRDLAQCADREIAQRDAELAAYRSADWLTAPAGVLIAELDRLIALRNDFYWLFFLVTMSMVLRTGALSRWARSRAPDVPFGDLVRGLSGLKGLEPMAEIGRLAALARALPPDAQALLLEADEAAIRRQLSADAAGRDLIAQVDIFLRDYGYLSGNGSDFSAPAWDERPALIWRAVGRAALLPPPDSSADAAAIREEALHRVRARLHPTVCPAFNRLFASTLVYVALRERVSLLMSEYSYQVRRLVLALAARLVAAGDLTAADDIFYLTYDELRALAAGELAAGAARAQITTRTAEMVADAQIEPPEVIRGDPARLHVAPQPIEAASTYLSGIGGSAGVAHGRARVVRDPADAPPWLDRKDILVVPYSDVGWTPLFSSVGGIVAETGGQLSHTAIVAREYGLPAVVSVKGATRLIRDGQALTVDGNCGRVYLSADQPAAAS